MSTRTLNSFLNLYPHLKSDVFSLKKKMRIAYSRKLQFNFLRECKKECVTPTSLRMGKHLLTNDTFLLEALLLGKHIQNARNETKRAFLEYEKNKAKFCRMMNDVWKPKILDYLYNKLRLFIHKKENVLKRRLQKLILNSKWQRIGNNDNFINLSSKQLNDNEKNALRLGINFSTCTKKPNIVGINKALSKLNNKVDEETLNLAKGMILYNYVVYKDVNLFPKRLTEALKKLKTYKDIHITRADKTKAIVILDKTEYINKMTALLDDAVTYEKLLKDPLIEVNKRFHLELKKILGIDQVSIKKFSSKGSRLPYLYGVVKTHKQNNPLRPIISTVGTVTSKLATLLVNILQPIVGSLSDSHIKNNVQLVDQLMHFQLKDDHKMISFDVTSLFTTVPIEIVLEHLQEELQNWNIPYTVSQTVQLIKLCVEGTCFTFEGLFFRQKFGMQMGGKLSPIMANIFMEVFEKKIAGNIIRRCLYWRRYVDDVLSIWLKNQNVQEILEQLNNLLPSIKFTIEEEDNCHLAFLDIDIIRKENAFEFKIHRKATSNSLIINKNSIYNETTKRSAICSMFYRALSIVSPVHMDEEFEIINNIGLKNGYDQHFVEDCKSRAKKTFYQERRDKLDRRNNFLILPFHLNLTELEYPLKILGIEIAFRFDATIGRLLIRNSPRYKEGIIYKIPCACGSFYIGQTAVQLEKRVEQHMGAVRRDDISSACNQHYKQCNKEIKWREASALLKINDFYERNFVESACIKLTENNNFNISSGLYKIDKISQHIMEKQFKLNSII